MLRAKPEALLLMCRVLGHVDPSFLALKVPPGVSLDVAHTNRNRMWLSGQFSALHQPHFCLAIWLSG